MFSGSGSTASKENTRGLTIIKASYGLEGNFTDVTTDIQNLFKDGELNFNVSPQQIGILDPAPGVLKELQIQYKLNNGKKNLLTVQDNQQVLLSAPDVPKDKKDKSYTSEFFKALWTSIIIFVVGSLALDSYQSGKLIFDNVALGYLFLALTLGTFGYFYWAFMPLLLLVAAYWKK